ncbi:GSCFA domain-containing protein [Methylobrevis pamukkalensis]|uniref:GSCFA family protein n=1 Tax=Methylobrevis pamukkalensis TaxID=1439726 RepID=A0A1E3H258_9HYPH|nr:GSCFA domain-containing protein [Methylobrevis pamukkalensis]ODN70384.1 GSCFA family protein [Methylobrevis pamukkalensis]
MADHPYRRAPAEAFWKGAVSGLDVFDVDPVTPPAFTIAPADRVASAGSCFAQHIARYLKTSGFDFLVTETAHPIAAPEDAEAFNYGVYTARYGNIYTPRQLLQLFQRAYGRFAPLDDAWEAGGGRWIDPFRPQIQPGGFASRAEYDADRAQHFTAVRRAFETLDVFVFTLGLTEAWRSREDGAVYPLCPGVAGGHFDPARHAFHNFTAGEIVADMVAFLDLLRSVNPRSRVILTVSPVPLVATASGRHVLTATTYSKAVLRVACEQLVGEQPDVAYFPSYELVTGPQTRGRFLAEDLRSVTEEGVANVMRLFLKHHCGIDVPRFGIEHAVPAGDAHLTAMAELVRLNCDEEALARD